MTKILKFIRTNFNLDANDESNLYAIITDINAEIDSGNLDAYGRGISEGELYDLVDGLLFKYSVESK